MNTRSFVTASVAPLATGTASAQVFFDRASWLEAVDGTPVLPPYPDLAPASFAPGSSVDLANSTIRTEPRVDAR